MYQICALVETIEIRKKCRKKYIIYDVVKKKIKLDDWNSINGIEIAWI